MAYINVIPSATRNLKSSQSKPGGSVLTAGYIHRHAMPICYNVIVNSEFRPFAEFILSVAEGLRVTWFWGRDESFT